MLKKTLIAGALLAASSSVFAGPSEGDWEIVFSNAGGGFSHTDGSTALGAGIRAGKFFGSNHELGFGADFAYVDIDGGDSNETLNLAGFYRYNWATSESKDWIYGGVELELMNVTDSDFSSEAIRPHLGKKWMLSDDIAFDLNGGILIPTESGADETFDVRFGLSVFF